VIFSYEVCSTFTAMSSRTLLKFHISVNKDLDFHFDKFSSSFFLQIVQISLLSPTESHAPRYGSDSSGLGPQRGARFSTPISTNPEIQADRVSFPAVKRPERGVEHPPIT